MVITSAVTAFNTGVFIAGWGKAPRRLALFVPT
jgi:hypothetical protein